MKDFYIWQKYLSLALVMFNTVTIVWDLYLEQSIFVSVAGFVFGLVILLDTEKESQEYEQRNN